MKNKNVFYAYVNETPFKNLTNGQTDLYHWWFNFGGRLRPPWCAPRIFYMQENLQQSLP